VIQTSLRTAILGVRFSRSLLLVDSRRLSGDLWSHSVWTSVVFPALRPLFDELAETPSVHCRQLRGASEPVRYGRLDWSPEGAEKWTHQSPLTRHVSGGWNFVDLQLFAPPRKQLLAALSLPKAHVIVEPLTVRGESSRMAHDQCIHIAVHQAFWSQQVRAAVAQLSLAVSALVLEATSRLRSLNEFESLVREHFLYRGMLDHELPDLSRPRLRWVIRPSTAYDVPPNPSLQRTPPG
jgi:hypothetical protein